MNNIVTPNPGLLEFSGNLAISQSPEFHDQDAGEDAGPFNPEIYKPTTITTATKVIFPSILCTQC